MTEVSPELLTVALAALPLTELRAALPIAIGTFGLGVGPAYVFSVIGNLIPVPFILWLLPPVVRWTSRHWTWAHRVLDAYFLRLRRKHGQTFERAGMVVIAAFVCIPLPGTGAWTASILAVLFAIRPRYSIPGIAVGVLAAGLVVLAITTGTLGAYASFL
ncbi:hypothetical protein A2348_01045 [Candidatus Uhrbacteria bacterium RIFOXYB12_FULL_58_10]|uniref:Ligand-binding protein SH3 n=1 Tax=Candidatus Uhrbacteria bacterium RIFOXYB2_FULL_57_15 TaxID=1802422 RepID=A0A1F7W8T1_9BACT|nr:MAG: hypothetical protein A2348_01045 [Candidatus Uhrbacteria bacterium RIFOXYB12_FULL_58_10]OGL99006.1 MAG: hypothetical protein A2304_02555 [Candidatus Uhrbacteria bacterium RIFOXYB2_FULL_57_15]OGM00227.1 MAG: hypothetical protein A2501_01690 [Candidatus Uhrbacteria bacterium RIFOXYC12_FULL_57_11]